METITIYVSRDPVAAFDDVLHNETFTIPTDMTVREFVRFILENYIKTNLWMAKWIIREGDSTESDGEVLMVMDMENMKVDIVSDYIKNNGWPQFMHFKYYTPFLEKNYPLSYITKETFTLPLRHLNEGEKTWLRKTMEEFYDIQERITALIPDFHVSKRFRTGENVSFMEFREFHYDEDNGHYYRALNKGNDVDAGTDLKSSFYFMYLLDELCKDDAEYYADSTIVLNSYEGNKSVSSKRPEIIEERLELGRSVIKSILERSVLPFNDRIN